MGFNRCCWLLVLVLVLVLVPPLLQCNAMQVAGLLLCVAGLACVHGEDGLSRRRAQPQGIVWCS